MSLWEISFRIRDDYPFRALSAEHPDLPISMWCIWDRELLQVPTQDLEVLGAVEKGIRKAGRIVDQWMDVQDGRLFLLKCTCARHDSLWNTASEFQAVDAPPAVFKDGWGYWRLLTFGDAQIPALFKALNKRGPTELLRKQELSLNILPTSVWVHSLFQSLTAKQIDSVLKAHRHGYYTSPREVTTEQIARGLGIGRSTYEESLRKAENRIMGALVPYLQLFSAQERPEKVLLSKESALELADSKTG